MVEKKKKHNSKKEVKQKKKLAVAVESRDPAKAKVQGKTTSNRVSFISGFFGREDRDMYKDGFVHRGHVCSLGKMPYHLRAGVDYSLLV